MPLQIGITGGIGSGKSLVCNIFRRLGVPAYDADDRAKYLMTTDGILMSGIKKEFGELSFNRDGSLNRGYISNIVFHDPERLAVLNKLVHPRVAADYNQWVMEHPHAAYVVKEAALLVESHAYRTLDKLIVVYAPEELRIDRVLKRDRQRTRQQVKEIIARQMPEEEKLKKADNIIRNDETELVIPQVIALHRQFTNRHDA